MTVTLKTALLFGMSGALGIVPAAFGQQASSAAVETTNTQHIHFSPGGILRIRANADITIEGWNKPEVEVTVVKSAPDGCAVRIVSGRKSETELDLSAVSPAGGRWSRALPTKTLAAANCECEIHVPRETKLSIHSGTGSIFVNGVSGPIDGYSKRGDIVLMLPDAGAYSIDAKSKLGTVSSDFKGVTHVRRYGLGQSLSNEPEPTSQRIRLRMGLGGITIKAVPQEGLALN